MAKNVLMTDLQCCCLDPMTGFYRNGKCDTGKYDYGTHIICAKMTAEFLEFSRQQGNDLTTPAPQFDFPGLKPGDKWCLCISRWVEAEKDGCAPPVVLEATHVQAIEHVDIEVLKKYAVKN